MTQLLPLRLLAEVRLFETHLTDVVLDART